MPENTNQDNNEQQVGLPGMPPPNNGGVNDIAGGPKVGKLPTNILGFVIVILFLLTGYYMYALWPIQIKDASGNLAWDKSMTLIDGTIEAEQRMIVLVLLAGLCGSLIHAATSFSNFVGEGKLDKSWIWWYILRPIIGMGVALVFYIIFRAGLMSNTGLETLNVYGIMTLAALAGLFSDRATLKLKEIFETLFQPKDGRSGELNKNKEEIKGDEKAQA
jgi:hypothetical protein